MVVARRSCGGACGRGEGVEAYLARVDLLAAKGVFVRTHDG